MKLLLVFFLFRIKYTSITVFVRIHAELSETTSKREKSSDQDQLSSSLSIIHSQEKTITLYYETKRSHRIKNLNPRRKKYRLRLIGAI